MKWRATRTLTALVVAVCALSGCSVFDDKESEPMSTRIPAEPPADADVVCGMARVDVETAVGYEIDRVEGTSDEGGCLLWPVEGTLPRWALSVRVADVTSDEVRAWRAAIEGTSPSDVRAPEILYEDVLGGVWPTPRHGAAAAVAGGMSVVFAGDRAIVLLAQQSAEGRDVEVDLLALSHQVAASEGLTLERASAGAAGVSPTGPVADVGLLCGMDRSSVENSVGYPVGRVEGSLEEGECTLWPVEGTFLREWVLVARVIDATSDEAIKSRGAIEGTPEADNTRPPDVRYADVLGGAWRVELGTAEATSRAGAVSIVFAGERAIALTSDVSADGRDAPTDLLTLSHQVAASLGLALDQAEAGP